MAYVHKIYEFDLENDFGTGAVTAVFFNFCSFHCKGCWNSETWERKEELYMDDSKLSESVIQALKKYAYKKDLALLGGDPLVPENVESTLWLIKEVKQQLPATKIGVWTGYRWERLIKKEKQVEALHYIDYLIDSPFILSKKVKLRRYGSYNQRVIDVQNSLKTHKIVVEDAYAQENTKHILTHKENSLVMFDNYRK